MIVWLNVPNAQKDAARRLGARWSVENDRWYVQDAEDLAPFLRWIDDRLKQPTKSQAPKSSQVGAKRQKKKGAATNSGANAGCNPNLSHMKRIEEWRRSQQDGLNR